jgi:hypothetical protein
MIQNDEKKMSPIVIDHWKRKFDKAIRVLLNGGVMASQLIEEIKIVDNEKNN